VSTLFVRALWDERLAEEARTQMMAFQVTLVLNWRQQLYKKSSIALN
jgi:hypothetical protein